MYQKFSTCLNFSKNVQTSTQSGGLFELILGVCGRDGTTARGGDS